MDDYMAELRFRAERGDILCLNEHVAHTDQVDVWLECGGVELARYTPAMAAMAAAWGSEQWLKWTMDKHALEVATKLVRKLLNDGTKRPPPLSPEERKKRADSRDRGVLNDGPGGADG